MTISTTPSSGNDFIVGADTRDIIDAQDGDDIVFAGGGNDKILAGNGDDQVFGGEGNDKIRAGRGDDTLDGGEGNDKLYGNSGNNDLRGGIGNDYINSGVNTSLLDGGADDDRLEMDLRKGADHTATGGSGADAFVFYNLTDRFQSQITITDFELGTDTFSILGLDGATYVQAFGESVVTEEGGNAVLTLFNGDTIEFQGITETEFETFFGL